MKILIDIDDVLNNLCEEWCLFLNEKYGTSVTYDQVTEWNIRKFFPSLAEEQVYEPLRDSSLWDRLKPKPGAVEYVKRLMDDGHEVYLCTSTDYRNIRDKFEKVVQKYYPFIGWSQVIVARRKQMINADFLIDDAPHNLIGGDYIKILFTAPHNRTFDAVENDMFRADTWKDVYGFISWINFIRLAKSRKGGLHEG